MTMQDTTVLLTGASGAIGAEVARRLATRGARLALSGRRQERLTGLADQIAATGPARPVVLPADLAQRGQATDLAAQATQALGEVEVLINNAGANLQGLTWVVGDREEARAVLETNLWSPLALTAALAPRMLRRGRGAIINVGSMARVAPFPHLGHYAASRAALALATQVLHLELGVRGVRVVEVALGPVDTPTSREVRMLTGAARWLDTRPGLSSVDAAAATIVDAATGDAEGVVFHPHALRWVDRLPGLGRHFMRRLAKGADLDDQTVRMGGSAGDSSFRALHQQWGNDQAGPARRPQP